ncbi:MAG TPA: hypothetical protein VG479_08560 [Gaiellaceae bacterium]|nr:hypothetical protein [Gaiellaceae bacterium]
MRPISTVLDRFRRAAAVPAVVGDELTVELAPVFLALDSIEDESDCIRRAAEQSVERQLAAARDETAGETAEAHRRAEAVRARALAERRDARQAEARALLTAAEAEARAIGERGAARAPGLAAEVVACVKAGPR